MSQEEVSKEIKKYVEGNKNENVLKFVGHSLNSVRRKH